MKLPDGREVDEQLYRERFEDSVQAGCRSPRDYTPCRFCLRPAWQGQPYEELKECDGCYEVVHRLEGFLKGGGEEATVLVHEALRKTDACWHCGHFPDYRIQTSCQCDNDE